jgi:hypothetical protein
MVFGRLVLFSEGSGGTYTEILSKVSLHSGVGVFKIFFSREQLFLFAILFAILFFLLLLVCSIFGSVGSSECSQLQIKIGATPCTVHATEEHKLWYIRHG